MTSRLCCSRMLTPEQAKERDALLAVEQTGREALSEMRRLVGSRLTEAPPSSSRSPAWQLSKLVAQTGVGLPLNAFEGKPVPLPPVAT